MSVKYQRKPEQIRTVQFTGTNAQECVDFAGKYLEIRNGTELWTKNGYQVRPTQWTCKKSDDDGSGKEFTVWDDVHFINVWALAP